MTRSTKRSRTALLFVCTFVFTAGLSTTALAALCTPQAIVNCERIQRNCLSNGLPPDVCERAYLGCMGRAGCEVP
ncbi:hypothetical protein [Lysobacter capsici]|uniref:hypothetical protein n=1 Tax=Lysobacter capsici TaxID=435897 RepID=UPI00287B90EB|nr:hypothetical protein [Lysobacter capsici]WND78830.1 hypothetical protein RJ610_16165 [Lysobacter capsici]WND84025.1 hypothetical protein RJ609_16175 [Lysobacter capsici]